MRDCCSGWMIAVLLGFSASEVWGQGAAIEAKVKDALEKTIDFSVGAAGEVEADLQLVDGPAAAFADLMSFLGNVYLIPDLLEEIEVQFIFGGLNVTVKVGAVPSGANLSTAGIQGEVAKNSVGIFLTANGRDAPPVPAAGLHGGHGGNIDAVINQGAALFARAGSGGTGKPGFSGRNLVRQPGSGGRGGNIEVTGAPHIKGRNIIFLRAGNGGSGGVCSTSHIVGTDGGSGGRGGNVGVSDLERVAGFVRSGTGGDGQPGCPGFFGGNGGDAGAGGKVIFSVVARVDCFVQTGSAGVAGAAGSSVVTPTIPGKGADGGTLVLQGVAMGPPAENVTLGAGSAPGGKDGKVVIEPL